MKRIILFKDQGNGFYSTREVDGKTIITSTISASTGKKMVDDALRDFPRSSFRSGKIKETGQKILELTIRD